MAKHRFHASNLQWFWHELSMLQQQGNSISESLDHLCFDPVTQQQDSLIVAIRDQYKQKNSLADALSSYTQYINQGTLSLIRLGEKQGSLPQVVRHLAHRQDNFSFMRIVLKALNYPIIILVACLLLSLGLMIFVIPIFAEMFASMGRNLPALTLFFFWLSTWLADFWWLVLLGFMGTFVLLKKNKYLRFNLMLRMPILKNCLQFIAISELLEAFAVTVQHESQAKETLVAITSTLSNPVYRESWQKEFQDNHDILACFRQTSCFPDAFIRVISVAKGTEMLNDVCARLAQQAVESAQDALESFAMWTRIALIFLVGLLVGSIVIAMYLPIFQMASFL